MKGPVFYLAAIAPVWPAPKAPDEANRECSHARVVSAIPSYKKEREISGGSVESQAYLILVLSSWSFLPHLPVKSASFSLQQSPLPARPGPL